MNQLTATALSLVPTATKNIVLPAITSSVTVPTTRQALVARKCMSQPRRTPFIGTHAVYSRSAVGSLVIARPTHIPLTGSMYQVAHKSSINIDMAQSAAASKTAEATATSSASAVANPEGSNSRHFKVSSGVHPLGIEKTKEDTCPTTWENPMGPSVWTKEEVESVKITHLPANDAVSKLAYSTAQLMRHTFDLLAGFKTRTPNEDMYLNRIIFLETVAGVPGMVAAMLRHLNSLRKMDRDHGWIHTLLEEAENERMHLLTFIKMKQPGLLFRGAVLVVQGVLFNVLFLSYMIKPRFCHRLVGYIEEEAVKTYTSILNQIDEGKLPLFKTTPVPEIAQNYWRLAPTATFRDLILAVRADEANHRLVNHTFANIKPDDYNPFVAKRKVIDESEEVKGH